MTSSYKRVLLIYIIRGSTTHFAIGVMHGVTHMISDELTFFNMGDTLDSGLSLDPGALQL